MHSSKQSTLLGCRVTALQVITTEHEKENEKMRTAKINSRQLSILEGIAYRIADINFLKAKYGDDAEHEIEASRKTMKSLFADADRENIPFFVQNTVICYFEDFTKYLETSVTSYLTNHKHYDITLEV